jgi:hypothetical protein
MHGFSSSQSLDMFIQSLFPADFHPTSIYSDVTCRAHIIPILHGVVNDSIRLRHILSSWCDLFSLRQSNKVMFNYDLIIQIVL